MQKKDNSGKLQIFKKCTLLKKLYQKRSMGTTVRRNMQDTERNIFAQNIGPLLETHITILNRGSQKTDMFITISLLISEGSRKINLPNKTL